MSAATPGQGARSRVSVEATRLNEDETGWTEAAIFIERLNDHGHELEPMGMLEASPAELREVHERLKLYFEQGIWSFRTVERNDHAAQDARPAPGMHPLSGLIANSYALYKFAQGGEWLTCEDDGRLDMRKELLAVKAAVREALKGTLEPKPVPELAAAIQDIIDRYPEQQPAPVSPAGPELPRVIDITGEVLTAAVEGKRILLQLGGTTAPKAAPELAAAMAALATEMHAEAQAVTGSEPDGMPDIADRVRAQVLHEYASRIRQALSHAGVPS